MDDRQLMIFRTVAQERSFSRAASLLYLSQPTVSQQIQALEKIYGVRLLDRTSKSVALTAGGRTLYERSEQILHQLTDTRRAVVAAMDAVIGPLQVGASQTIGEYILPRVIAAFQRSYPAVETQLQIDNTEQIEGLVLNGLLDLALVEGPVASPELIQTTFLVDRLVVIAPKAHRWKDTPEISLEDLKGEQLIVREPGSGTRRVMEEALSAAGVSLPELPVAAEMAGMEAIKGAVEAGMGVACMSEWAIRKELRLGSLLARSIRGLPIHRKLRIIYPNGHTLVPAAAALLDLLQSPGLMSILE